MESAAEMVRNVFRLEGSEDTLRKGVLETPHGEIHTPVFMPIATKGSVKHLLPEELRAVGAQIVLGNTYHLWLRPGHELVAKAGGLQTFMHWNGPILTDSGGFQVFSLGARAEQRFGMNGVKLTEEGVEFSDPTNGNRYFLTPEKSIEIQLGLGSDIIMVLDECPPYPCSHEYAKRSLELTTRWARRSKEYFESQTKHLEPEKRPLLFGIVQGSVYEDLRQESARQLVEIGFDGYAIGGVAVGEPRETLGDILGWTLPYLPADRPRYLMGLGRPEEVVASVRAGVDMFDCVIPTREGRHGRLFVWNASGDVSVSKSFFSSPSTRQASTGLEKNVSSPKQEDWMPESFYETINITNERYREDFGPIDPTCDCSACQHYSRAYIRHLFTVDEPLGPKLASLHNIRFYTKLMETLRGR